MKYVVDASVALKWFVQEDGHLNALRLTSGALSLMAPDIVKMVTADMKFAAKAAAAGFGKKIAVLEAIPATGLTGFNDGLENDNG